MCEREKGRERDGEGEGERDLKHGCDSGACSDAGEEGCDCELQEQLLPASLVRVQGFLSLRFRASSSKVQCFYATCRDFIPPQHLI
jgi:hypothetical protein